MARLLANILLLLVLPFQAAGAAEPVRVFVPDSFSRIVADHAGRPFVIMVWSLDCEYCHASFQALAQASRTHRLPVVTISTDRADDRQAVALIREQLQAGGLASQASQAWAFGAAAPEALRHAIDPKWRGELPRSYWFRADGTATPYSGMITAATVDRLAPR